MEGRGGGSLSRTSEAPIQAWACAALEGGEGGGWRGTCLCSGSQTSCLAPPQTHSPLPHVRRQTYSRPARHGHRALRVLLPRAAACGARHCPPFCFRCRRLFRLCTAVCDPVSMRPSLPPSRALRLCVHASRCWLCVLDFGAAVMPRHTQHPPKKQIKCLLFLVLHAGLVFRRARSLVLLHAALRGCGSALLSNHANKSIK